MRAEHALDGLGVTLVCPGLVRTPMGPRSLDGDGSPRGDRADATAKGMPAARCAAVVLDAVHRGRNEVYLKRYAPSVLAFLLPRRKPS